MDAWCPPSAQRGPNSTLASFLGTPDGQQLDGSRIHIMVISGVQFYDNRLAWGRATWAKSLAPNITLSVIGDEPGPDIPGTTCKPYTNNVCCKIAKGLSDIVAKGDNGEPYDWVFVVDDDAYVNTHGLRHFLAAEWSPWIGRAILGNAGCGTKFCKGICGGGGIALTRASAERMVKESGVDAFGHRHEGTNFYDEFMSECQTCEGWGDLTISQLAERRDCTLRPALGVNPWELNPKEIKTHLKRSCEVVPLTFHYLKTKDEFQDVYDYLSQHPIEDCKPLPWNARKHPPR